MSQNRSFDTVTVQAAGDLRSYQYHIVTLAGARTAVATFNVAGLLITKPQSGDHMSVGIAGNMKFKAGGTITQGAHLTVNASATLEAAASGNAIYGKALETAASGDIANGYFNFATPGRAINTGNI